MDVYMDESRHQSFRLAAAAQLVTEGKITIDDLLDCNPQALLLVGFRTTELWVDCEMQSKRCCE